jgi:hypothetical protein
MQLQIAMAAVAVEHRTWMMTTLSQSTVQHVSPTDLLSTSVADVLLLLKKNQQATTVI